MDIRKEYNTLIVKIENKEELIKIQSFINSIKNVDNDLTDSISIFPNYFLYRMDINKFNFLTNSSSNDDNEIYQLEILKRHVLDNHTYKGYPIIFNLDEKSLNRIKNIIIFGKDYVKPDYRPKKILRESTDFKYNGWIVFKTNDIEDTNYIMDNLDIDSNAISQIGYPHYIFYNFTDKKLVNLSHHNDDAALRFIDGINKDYNHVIYSDKYIIPHIFNIEDVSKINIIRNVGLDKPDYSPKKIAKFESFLNEEIEPIMFPDWENLEISKEDEEKLKLQYVKKLGKSGELLDYVKKGKTKLTFGILRSLFNDAISYKKKRELTKGIYKFVHRIVPIALAAFWFPVWVLAQVLGGSRALNKVLIPVLKMNPSNYKSFLVTLITKTMDLMEGEIKTFMGDDWYYRVFMVDWGLIKMIRKEHVYNFALHVATVMENEPDEKIVPIYYIENEMRKWLNNTFNINPAMPLKTEEIVNESVDYSYIKKFLD